MITGGSCFLKTFQNVDAAEKLQLLVIFLIDSQLLIIIKIDLHHVQHMEGADIERPRNVSGTILTIIIENLIDEGNLVRPCQQAVGRPQVFIEIAPGIFDPVITEQRQPLHLIPGRIGDACKKLRMIAQLIGFLFGKDIADLFLRPG